MLKQTDLQGRLRLLRYGLLVVVIVTFVVSLSYPVVALQDTQRMGEFLGQSLLYTVVVAVICVVIYFVYDYILHKTMGPGAGEEQKPASGETETK